MADSLAGEQYRAASLARLPGQGGGRPYPGAREPGAEYDVAETSLILNTEPEVLTGRHAGVTILAIQPQAKCVVVGQSRICVADKQDFQFYSVDRSIPSAFGEEDG